MSMASTSVCSVTQSVKQLARLVYREQKASCERGEASSSSWCFGVEEGEFRGRSLHDSYNDFKKLKKRIHRIWDVLIFPEVCPSCSVSVYGCIGKPRIESALGAGMECDCPRLGSRGR